MRVRGMAAKSRSRSCISSYQLPSLVVTAYSCVCACMCVGFHFFKPPMGAHIYFSYPIFQIPLSRSYYETEILSVSSAFPLANKINERGAAAKRTSRSFHTQTEGESKRRMPSNVFCLVIVLFCVRQIDKTPATVTNRKKKK